MASLTEFKCVPCHGGVPQLTQQEIEGLLPQVPGWEVIELDGILRLSRAFKFKNFKQALAFTDQVGELAEDEGHHPAILTEWGKVTVTTWTHAIKGLHQNDFILAAKTDQLYQAVM